MKTALQLIAVSAFLFVVALFKPYHFVEAKAPAAPAVVPYDLLAPSELVDDLEAKKHQAALDKLRAQLDVKKAKSEAAYAKMLAAEEKYKLEATAFKAKMEGYAMRAEARADGLQRELSNQIKQNQEMWAAIQGLLTNAKLELKPLCEASNMWKEGDDDLSEE